MRNGCPQPGGASHVHAQSTLAQSPLGQQPVIAADARISDTLQAFQADQSAWTMQPMLGFVRSLRIVAEAADAQLAQGGRRPEKLADCLDRLRKLFQAAQQAAGMRQKLMTRLTSHITLLRLLW